MEQIVKKSRFALLPFYNVTPQQWQKRGPYCLLCNEYPTVKD